MPSDIRLKRIQDQIHQVMTEILESRVNDPRLDHVYVTDVSVDRELDFANIYVASLAGKDQAQDILDGLEAASGFIRYNLSQEMKLRVMPKLRFFWDETPDHAERIEELLSEIRSEREARGDVDVEPEGDLGEELDESTD
ncbi:MAG: 30S ribosome-binding factor RbfA [Brevefilum sp.]